MAGKPRDKDVRTIRPFPAVLQEIGKGDLAVALAEALNALTLSVMDAQKAGTLTLVIKLEPTTKDGYSETLTTTAQVSVKEPRQTQAAIFYVDGDGNLQRNHPDQPQLPLRDVSAPRTGSSFTATGDGDSA